MGAGNKGLRHRLKLNSNICFPLLAGGRSRFLAARSLVTSAAAELFLCHPSFVLLLMERSQSR